MISLDTPSSGCDYYFHWKDCMFGPYDPSGRLKKELMQFPSSLEAMVEAKGIWHENDVQHDKVTGNLFYHPLLNGAIPLPTELLPDQWKYPVFNTSNSPTWLTAKLGLATNQCVHMWKGSTSTNYQYAYSRDIPGSEWTVWMLNAVAGNPYFAASGWIYRIKAIHGVNSQGSMSFEYTTQQFGPGWTKVGFDISQRQSLETIVGAFSAFASPGLESAVLSTGLFTYRARALGVMSPSDARAKIDVLVAAMGWDDNFPIDDKHYGDLAMEASQRVNANSVNMLAFLKDLRHPSELVPKLRNLRRLKTLSSNYLTAEYGILPTIDDIQSIVAAFRRIGPYLDRNGFSTYSAGFTDSKSIGTMSYSKEQHIKLAIGDEDSDFQELISRLESMGTLPTAQNVWDLLPYSFVVDWLVDVGGFLERVDTRLRLARLNIRYVTMSRKSNAQGVLPLSGEFPFEGSVNWVRYHRWVSDQCPVPPLSLQTTFQDFDHWLESGALLAQRTKR